MVEDYEKPMTPSELKELEARVRAQVDQEISASFPAVGEPLSKQQLGYLRGLGIDLEASRKLHRDRMNLQGKTKKRREQKKRQRKAQRKR